MEHKPYNINITTVSIVKILATFLLLYFLYVVRDILLVLFIALILSSAIKPWVDWMQSKRIPRALGMVFIYLALAIIFSSVIYLIIPPIVDEIGELSKNAPLYFEKIASGFTMIKGYADQYASLAESLDSIKNNLQSSATGLFAALTNIFGGIVTFFLVLVITFYMVVEEDALKKVIWSVVPMKQQPYIMRLIVRMQRKIGQWLTGQLILCLVIGAMIFMGLTIMRVKYALVLALMAGLFEFIPYLGPTLGAIPAIFLAFSQSPMLAVFVGIFYYLVQFTENNILVPKIMQRAVGLNPIVSITVLLMGFKLAGVVGAIISIPVATAINVFIQDVFDNKVGEVDGLSSYEE